MAHNNDIPADKREHSTNTSNSKIGHRRTTACNARNCWRKKTNTRRYRGLLARRMTVLRPASSEAPCTQQPTHVVSKVHAQARGTDKKNLSTPKRLHEGVDKEQNARTQCYLCSCLLLYVLCCSCMFSSRDKLLQSALYASAMENWQVCPSICLSHLLTTTRKKSKWLNKSSNSFNYF